MTRYEIKNYIVNKSNIFSETELEYIINYFEVLSNNPQILGNVKLEDLIDNALLILKGIVFYEIGDENYMKLNVGPDVKGKKNDDDGKIYIRNNLGEPLREITLYHELHHVVQTNTENNNKVGIMSDANSDDYDCYGRLIMEGQTQYFAEKVYEEIHNVTFEEREIQSENLRMKGGGTIVSSLHNYELYDAMLSKLAIYLGVSKDFFVKINYMFKDKRGLKELEQLFNYTKEKKNRTLSFNRTMYLLDYIYTVDYMAYIDNPDKAVLLSGGETKESYEIHSVLSQGETLSFNKAFMYISSLERTMLANLLEENDYRLFIKYLMDNQLREQIKVLLGEDPGDYGNGSLHQ